MAQIKIRRPRMRQAFSYKIIGECGFYFNKPDTFDTEAQAEKDAKRSVAALKKLGKTPTEILIESRLVPSKHIEQLRVIDGGLVQVPA